MLRGQLAEAAELLDGAVEGARLSGNVQALAGNLFNRSLAALAAGDVETALATAEESVELTRGLDQSLVSRGAGAVLAGALFENGEPRRAIETLAGCAGRRGTAAHPRRLESQLPRAADPLLARTRTTPSEAGTRGRECREHAATLRTPHWPMRWLDRAAAAVSLDAGDPADAAEHALASAAAADEVGAPVEAAVSRIARWAAHWQRPGRPSVLSPSWTPPPPRCTPAAP